MAHAAAGADEEETDNPGIASLLGGALDTMRSWTPEARRQAAAAQEKVNITIQYATKADMWHFTSMSILTSMHTAWSSKLHI